MKTTYSQININTTWTILERVNIFFQDLIELPKDIREDGFVDAISDCFTQRYLR